MKDDKEVVLAAVKQDGDALKYASRPTLEECTKDAFGKFRPKTKVLKARTKEKATVAAKARLRKTTTRLKQEQQLQERDSSKKSSTVTSSMNSNSTAR